MNELKSNYFVRLRLKQQAEQEKKKKEKAPCKSTGVSRINIRKTTTF